MGPGERIGRYRVVRKIGAGGMGIVYEAVDEPLRRTVALKLLPPELVGDPERRARFLTEARAAAAVEHRSIVSIYEVGESEGHVFIAMEYVRGESLRERIDRGPLGVGESLSVAAAICRGLVHAHAAGFLHRDLKPDNVMLDQEGEVRILDFGLAKSLDASAGVNPEAATCADITAAGDVLGSPGYMSPEQARGQEVDKRTDLFSLGVMLYEMIGGERPFSGSTGPDLLAAVIRDTPRPLGELRSVPSLVADVVAQCLEKDPAKRPASASALLERLEAASDALSSHESAKTELGPSTRSAVPRRIGKAWIAAGLVLIAAAGVGVWRSRRSKPVKRQDPAAPLHAPGAIIACPILSASGVEKRNGTLGAAAASSLCRSISAVLGADEKRVRIPAQLLGLPKQAVDTFPDLPFEAPDARRKSIDAAKRFAGWVDGKERWNGEKHFLELQLHTALGPVGAPVKVSNAQLARAGWAATDKWVERGALKREPPGADFKQVFGCDDPHCTQLASIWDNLSTSQADRAVLCNELRRVSRRGWLATGDCPAAAGAIPPVDKSSPVAFAVTADANITRATPAQNFERAARLARYVKQRSSADAVKQLLTDSEIGLYFVGGRATLARAVADRAVVTWPTDACARMVANETEQGGAAHAALRAYGAWVPQDPQAFLPRWSGKADALPDLRLAFALSSAATGVGPMLAIQLLKHGKLEEARLIASRYLAGARAQHLAGAYVMSRVELAEHRPAAALRRLQAAIDAEPALPGTLDVGIFLLAYLGEVLGKEHAVADDFVRKVVLVDPPRLQPMYQYLTLGMVCLHASRKVGLACVDRVEALAAGGRLGGMAVHGKEYLAGVRRYLLGDDAGAVRSWKPMARLKVFAASLPPGAFDRAGEHALAAGIDAQHPDLVLSMVRRAHRAQKSGDDKKAAKLARKIIDDWATADADIPAVADMKKLLAQVSR